MIDYPEVLCVGVATLDTIATVDRVPADDERVLAKGPFVVAGGGPAATAAVTIARLGVSVGFCGVVGSDQTGDLIRAGLEAEGVDTRWLRQDTTVASVRSVNLVAERTGSRSIVTMPSVSPRPQDIPTQDVRWLYVDQTGYAPARAALRATPGARISVDAGNPIPGIELAGLDLYVPTADALASTMAGADLRERALRAAAAGARCVVVTDGARGAHVVEGDEVVHVPPHRVQVRSTMGAGDVFHGALVAGLVRGMATVEAVHQASVVAALSCRALDGRSAVPDLAETASALAESLQFAGRGEGDHDR